MNPIFGRRASGYFDVRTLSGTRHPCQETDASRKEKDLFNRIEKAEWRFLPCLKTEVSTLIYYEIS